MFHDICFTKIDATIYEKLPNDLIILAFELSKSIFQCLLEKVILAKQKIVVMETKKIVWMGLMIFCVILEVPAQKKSFEKTVKKEVQVKSIESTSENSFETGTINQDLENEISYLLSGKNTNVQVIEINGVKEISIVSELNGNKETKTYTREQAEQVHKILQDKETPTNQSKPLENSNQQIRIKQKVKIKN